MASSDAPRGGDGRELDRRRQVPDAADAHPRRRRRGRPRRAAAAALGAGLEAAALESAEPQPASTRQPAASRRRRTR